MLKTSTKQINPFAKILQKIIKEETEEDNNEDTYENKEPSSDKKLVFAEVPNYLERPIFTHAKPMLICMFQIRMDGLYPYLLFLLHKNKRKTMFNFVNFPSFDGGKVSKNLKKEAVKFMHGKIEKGDISYAGFTENENNNIIILKYIETTLSVPTDDYCWTSTHELINLKTIMTPQPIVISPSVFNFFLKNSAFLLLRNDKEVIYETPVIGYYPIAKGALTDIFRETLRNDIGSCYYFYVEPPKKNDGDDIIIMRSLLFLGRLGLIEKIKNINVCDSFLLTTDDHVKMYAINRYSQHLPLSYA
jgi:hypothetical protein